MHGIIAEGCTFLFAISSASPPCLPVLLQEDFVAKEGCGFDQKEPFVYAQFVRRLSLITNVIFRTKLLSEYVQIAMLP